MAELRQVIPPDRGEGYTRSWRPPCGQYRGYEPGFIHYVNQGQQWGQQWVPSYGNCSPNPPDQQYDFYCYWDPQWRRQRCHASNGSVGNSPEDVCCGFNNRPNPPYPPHPPRPVPPRNCFSIQSANDCAICLDEQQGDTSTPNHLTQIPKPQFPNNGA